MIFTTMAMMVVTFALTKDGEYGCTVHIISISIVDPSIVKDGMHKQNNSIKVGHIQPVPKNSNAGTVEMELGKWVC